MNLRMWAAVAAVWLLLLVAVAPPSLSATGTATSDDTDTTTVFRWESPRNLTGTFIGSLELETGTPSHCDIRYAATGRFDPDNPVVFWSRVSTDGGTAQSVGKWDRMAQAHAGDRADTRDATPVGGDWRVSGTSGSDIEDRLVYTVAGFGLQLLPNASSDAGPLSVNVTCQDPVDVAALHASRTGRSFDEANLEGGIGASVRFPTEATITRDDRLAHRFETDKARFQATIDDQDSNTEGDLWLRHPNGTRRWSIPHTGSPSIVLDGGPGRYTVGLNWTSVHSQDEVFGILVGLDRVDSWDAVT